VSSQLAAWWGAPAQLPQLPALGAALAAAAGSDGSDGAAAAALLAAAQPRLAVLLQLLVAGFFPLTSRDLDEWAADGEAWAHVHADHTASGGTEGLHPCCQQLVLSLVLADRVAAAPVLVTLLKGVSELVPAGWGCGGPSQQQQQLPGPSIPGPSGRGYPAVLLLKEAVYEAVALTAYDLHDALDYKSWLHTSLLPEMAAMQQQPGQQQQQQQLPLLPRAAARVVGQWVADLKPEDRPAVYTALTVLLVQPGQQQQGPDAVLQLAAVQALRVLVDDFGFEGPAFVGVLPAVVGALASMVADSDELDTQTQVWFFWGGSCGVSHTGGQHYTSSGSPPTSLSQCAHDVPVPTAAPPPPTNPGLWPAEPHHRAAGARHHAPRGSSAAAAAGRLARRGRPEPAAHPGAVLPVAAGERAGGRQPVRVPPAAAAAGRGAAPGQQPARAAGGRAR
jgi:hypothetical protein